MEDLKARGDLNRRMAVSAVAVAVAFTASRLKWPWLPAVAPGLPRLERMAGEGILGGLGNLTGLALGPALTAFLLVEVVALIVPRWRRLRLGAVQERATLTRAGWAITVIIALVQAFGVVRALSSEQNVEFGIRVPHAAPLIAMLVVPSLLALLVAQGVTRWGLGNGVALLLAAGAADKVFQALRSTASMMAALAHNGIASSGPAITYALSLAAIAFAATRLFGRFWPPGSRPVGLPLPTSGEANHQLFALITLPGTLLPFFPGLAAYADWINRGPLAYHLLFVLLLGPFCVGLSLLFNAPARVARTRQMLGAAPAEAVAVRAELWRAVLISWVFFAFVYAMQLLGAKALAGPVVAGYVVVTLTAVLLDLWAEVQFRRRLGSVTSIRPLHQAFAATAVVEALARQDIPALPRALCYRALTQFFGPLVPVDILVPTAHAARAGTFLNDHYPPRPL